jgi:hypothetical protein
MASRFLHFHFPGAGFGILRDGLKGGVLMKAKFPSVLRCIEEATQCEQRAAIAVTEADMSRELEM